MKSMTGFGRASNRPAKSSTSTRAKSSSKSKSVSSNVQLDVSLKSVNGRYLEIRLHMPREYAGLEAEIKKALGKYFSRGTVDVYVNRLRATTAPDITVNTALARKWLDAYQELAKNLNLSTKTKTKLKSETSLDLLIRVPEILRVEETVDLSDAEKATVKKLIQEAAEACEHERRREGSALADELESLIARLESISVEMEKLKFEANQELNRRFKERLQKLGIEGKVDDQRVAQEIVIQLDRADVSEELSRLREHLKAYKRLLSSEEPQGKKLDFYAQELLREVNTIGSKSHIARLTSLVVDAKTLVEKIREQVQNVE